MVQDDGFDEYDRFKAKVVLFIVPQVLYEQYNGLLFFASPLWLQSITLDKNTPLDYSRDFDIAQNVKKDFDERINKSFLAFLLDKMLFYSHLILMIDETPDLEKDRIFLMQAVAYIDSKLPVFLRNQITIKSLTNKDYSIANCLLLDHFTTDLALGDDYYVLSFSNKVLDKEFNFDSSKLARAIISTKTSQEKERISRSLFNPKALLKDDLLTSEQYAKLMNRFEIKDSKLWHRFFRNFSLR